MCLNQYYTLNNTDLFVNASDGGLKLTYARINEMPHSPPPGVGWGFVKIRVSKAPPLGQCNYEAGSQFA